MELREEFQIQKLKTLVSHVDKTTLLPLAKDLAQHCAVLKQMSFKENGFLDLDLSAEATLRVQILHNSMQKMNIQELREAYISLLRDKYTALADFKKKVKERE